MFTERRLAGHGYDDPGIVYSLSRTRFRMQMCARVRGRKEMGRSLLGSSRPYTHT